MAEIDWKYRKEQLLHELRELTEAAMRVGSHARGPMLNQEKAILEDIANIEAELKRLDTIVLDAIGQELNVGDSVAYVSMSSSPCITRRTVTETGHRTAPYNHLQKEPYVHLDNSNRVVMPYNVVKVAPAVE